MSLGLAVKDNALREKLLTIEKVSDYFSGTLLLMGKGESSEGKKAAEKQMAKHPLKVEDKETAYKTVVNMENKYKEKTSQASFKTKLEYFLGGHEQTKAMMAAMGAVVCGVMAVRPEMAAMAAPSVVLGASAFSTEAYALTSDDAKNNESKEYKEYVEAKKALFVLKKMKKMVDPKPSYKEEVRNLYASGLGNPGGMITALNLKNNGGR